MTKGYSAIFSIAVPSPLCKRVKLPKKGGKILQAKKEKSQPGLGFFLLGINRQQTRWCKDHQLQDWPAAAEAKYLLHSAELFPASRFQ